MRGQSGEGGKKRRSTSCSKVEDAKHEVVVEIDARTLTPSLFAALQPTWLRVGGYVLPLVGAACAFRLVGGPGAATTAGIVAIAAAIAFRIGRQVAGSHALRRAHPRGAVRVALGPEAFVRDGVEIGWNEVTDAAEIDTPMPKGEPVRVIAVRTRGTWSVFTPVARFVRGDYEAARALVSAARHVRVVTL